MLESIIIEVSAVERARLTVLKGETPAGSHAGRPAAMHQYFPIARKREP